MEANQIREIAKELAERRWYIVVERPFSPVLDWDSGVSTVNHHFSNILKTEFNIDGFLFFQNKLLVDMKEHKRINQFLLNKYKTDKKYLRNLAKEMENCCDFFVDFTKKLDKDNLNSIKEFFKEFNKGIVHFRWVYNAAEVFEQIVKEGIGKPLKKNYITKYNLALDKIKKEIKNQKLDLNKIKKNKEVINQINNFLKEFAWIKIFHHQGEPLTFETLIEELKHTLDAELNQKENKDLHEDIELLRYTIFLRTHIAESFNTYAGANLKPALEKLGKKFNLTYEDIAFLTQKEIIETIDTGKLPITKQQIEQRKKGFACINLNNEYNFIYGKDLEQLNYFYNYFAKNKKENKEVIVLQGTSANEGYVKGTAKVITNVNEFHKFNKGDILIANSTTPNYIPIMGKASAFLTDEGGITCHAAIVSREMGKPCIIGLKNATKVFKDGDLVEVDADKGIVKIIKRR